MLELHIKSKQLRIRNLKDADLDDFHAYRSNPQVCEYQGFDPMTRAQAADFIRAQANLPFGKLGQWVQYGIEHQVEARLIGDCAIHLHQEQPTAEIGITIAPRAQQKGYAKEVLAAILDFLFTTQQIQTVVERVDTQNIASIALLRSLGFVQHSPAFENIWFKGKFCSEWQFSMQRENWLDMQPKIYPR